MVRIDKIMSSDFLILSNEAKILDAARLMADKRHGCVIIVEDKKVIGIVTESDILRNFVSKNVSLKSNITQIMSYPVTTINQNEKLEKANKIVDSKQFRKYPVVDGQNFVVGLVRENEIVHALNDNISFHRNLQNAVLVVFVAFEFFVFIYYRYLVNIFLFLR